MNIILHKNKEDLQLPMYTGPAHFTYTANQVNNIAEFTNNSQIPVKLISKIIVSEMPIIYNITESLCASIDEI